jgi:hypothetical protein
MDKIKIVDSNVRLSKAIADHHRAEAAFWDFFAENPPGGEKGKTPENKAELSKITKAIGDAKALVSRLEIERDILGITFN